MRENRIVRKKIVGMGNTSMTDSGTAPEVGERFTQDVFCPKCHKRHCREYALINEFICCECGCNFYAFVDKGLNIIIPAQEAEIDRITRAMRRFVVMTGRCQDINPKLLEYSEEDPNIYLQERDLRTEFAKLLEEYQVEYFDDCFITREVVDSICAAFEHNADVQLKKQKNGVDICEMKKPKRCICSKPTQGERIMRYSKDLRKMQSAGETQVAGNRIVAAQ